MKTSEVKIGNLFKAKVTNKLVTIKILSENPNGGWDALNTATGKKIRIKSVRRLQSAVDSNEKPPAPPAVAITKTVGNHDAKQTEQPNTRQTETLSITGAALKVLQENKTPLSCSQMVAKMTKAGCWKPSKGGKTPANTLYAAILRDIKTKGENARFEKVGRGLFAIKK